MAEISDEELRGFAKDDPLYGGYSIFDKRHTREKQVLANAALAARKELAEARAQLARLSGNAPIASPISEEDRKNLQLLHPAAIEHPVQKLTNKVIAAMDAAHHELARHRAVLMDRRLDDGMAELREACAKAAASALVKPYLNADHGLAKVTAAIRAVPITGEVARREKEWAVIRAAKLAEARGLFIGDDLRAALAALDGGEVSDGD